MKKINWLDLSEKLVDRFNMDNTNAFVQKAIGDFFLSIFGEGVLVTNDFPNPFPVTLSGASLGGTVDAGIAGDANGQIIVAPTNANPFVIPTASLVHPRKDLLVIRYKMTGVFPVPKPTAPLTTVFLYLVDDFELAIIPGVPAAIPVYPAKGPNDVILAGILVPTGALLGTTCTLDLTQRELCKELPGNIYLDPTNLQITKQSNLQTYLNILDAFISAGEINVGDDGLKHDSATLLVNSGGVGGDTITIAGVTYTIGAGVGQIPVQGSAAALAVILARRIREDATLSPTYTAVAGGPKVEATAKASGAVGGAISTTGTTFTVPANFAGNGARSFAIGGSAKRQIDQIDTRIFAIPSAHAHYDGAVIPYVGIDSHIQTSTLALSTINLGALNGGVAGATVVQLNQYRAGVLLATATASLPASAGAPTALVGAALSATLNLLSGDLVSFDVNVAAAQASDLTIEY